MLQPFEVIALNAPGFPTPAVAVAAQRAGFQGGLSLEHASARECELAIKAVLSVGIEFTVCIGNLSDELLVLLTSSASAGLRRIVLCDTDAPSLQSTARRLKAAGLSVLVQVTCLEHARLAERLGADGVVIKGSEAGGRIGEETTFVLLQRVLSHVRLPVLARGGVGEYTAAACRAAGAAGVVLDWQLALAVESDLPEAVKTRITRMDGSETAIVGLDLRQPYRAYSRPGETSFAALRELETRLCLEMDATTASTWRDSVEQHIAGRALSGERDAGIASSGRLLIMGQDAVFATALARKYETVGGICRAIRRSADSCCRRAARHQALRPDGPLAAAHGTPYPIVQGPMTRVSDTADFALAVAEGGGLPFLALALMRGPQVGELLEETRRKLGERPWGIGILGFVPRELRDEQLAEVRRHPPPYAIIAGGRPDQAQALEAEGIHTYLHVPSPGLLKMFLEQGARRVIFEGRECGGHVGPRSSFVLWEQMIQTILEHLKAAGGAGGMLSGQSRGEDHHVLFAGGIHDAMSASMVAALAAPLTERGVRIGVLMGTAYLFTQEAVEGKAIVPGFQQEAVRCEQTILLESGVGHATRCADTEFGRIFNETKRRLIREGRPAEEIREVLEGLNLGRLRIASKGVSRGDGNGSRYVSLDEQAQHREGMYMIGQVAALRNSVCTIRQLHEDVSQGGVERLREISNFQFPISDSQANVSYESEIGDRKSEITCGRDGRAPRASDIAIVGMSCMFPKAGDLRQYWENILNKVNALGEVPPERWDWRLYFDENRLARDKVYSRWGGFIDDVNFDPMRYGMPPNTLPSIEPLQLLVLEAARQALEDAGYGNRPFERDRTSVVIGAGGGVADLGNAYGFRSLFPYFATQAGKTPEEAAALVDKLNGYLPEWTEDSFAGLLMNVAAGRIANRLDLGGTNFTVDAACASSLAAVRLAVNELESGSSDMVLVGGADTMQNPFAYMCFSKTQALSPTGQCRPLDESADGIVISEGVAFVVCKRLEDARRDGDRIYAVIKGVGASSDGRAKGMTAPRPAGQMRALERAYTKAGISAATVGLMEAHGTGTVAGDQSEMESVSTTLARAGAESQACAVGSVKSLIGHTKCTAGVAGLIKVALALHHKVLPPTGGVTRPNSRIEGSPLYINSETRPWLARLESGDTSVPRRAGVSSFGFGGTNFHAVLEEYVPDDVPADPAPAVCEWPAELFVWRAESAAGIAQALGRLEESLNKGAAPVLRDLAACICREFGRQAGNHTLAVVATSLEDLATKLSAARAGLERSAGGAGETPAPQEIRDPRGIYYSCQPLVRYAAQEGARSTGDSCISDCDGKIAFLFSGQGSQKVNMLRDLAVCFPIMRAAFEEADHSLDLHRLETGATLGKPLSEFIYPPPTFTEEAAAANEKVLTQTQVAQPAMGAADMAMYRLLGDLDLRPDMAGGHSYGEYAALCAAGALNFADLIRVSEARGRCIRDAARDEPGTMAAVDTDEATVAAGIADIPGVVVANLNGPMQTVVSGTEAGCKEAVKRFMARGINARTFSVSCAFHSPLVAGAKEPFGRFLEQVEFRPPRFRVYSNTTALPHAADPAAIRSQLVDHLVNPVRFTDELRAMYEDGARIFVEVGPGKTLTTMVERTLEGKPHLAVQMDQPNRHGLLHLVHALGQLAVAGARLSLYRLFEGRMEQRLEFDRLEEQTAPKPLPPTTWKVNGARAVPLAKYGKVFEVGKENGKQAAALEAGIASGSEIPDSRSQISDIKPQISDTKSGFSDTKSQVANLTSEISDLRSQSSPSAQSAQFPAASHAAMVPPQAAGSAPVQAASSAPAQAVHSVPPQAAAGHVFTPVHTDGVRQVMSAYQQLMGRFLDTQKNVMLAYLQGSAAPGSHAAPGQPATGAAWSSGVAGQSTIVPQTPLSTVPQSAPLAVPQSPPLAVPRTPAPATAFPAEPMAPVAATIPATESALQTSIPAVPGPAGAAVAPAPAVEPPADPPAEIAAEPGAEAAAEPGLTRERLVQHLVGVVSDRTGYPPEMLDLDLDLEADLGIDSIKRVEILGTLQKDAVLPAGSAEGVMEELARLKTLNAIVTWILERSDQSATARPPEPAQVEPAPRPAPTSPATPAPEPAQPVTLPPPAPASDRGNAAVEEEQVPRLVLRAVEVARSAQPATIEGLVLITDDEGGIAAGLAEALRQRGLSVVVVASERDDGSNGQYPRVPLSNPSAVRELVETLRRDHGRIGALIHLLPLAADPADVAQPPSVEQNSAGPLSHNPQLWRSRLDEELISLYCLARELEPDLRSGSGAVLVATRMGGTFGSGDADSALRLQPLHGAVCGLAKSLAREWTDVRCHSLDCAFGAPTEEVVRDVVEILLASGGPIEIGYQNGRAIVLEPIMLPANSRPQALQIDDHAVILITGGARGITAEIAIELAERFRPTLVLAGRSPLPAGQEPPDTVNLAEARDIKAALARQIQQAGGTPVPAAIEAEYRRLIQQREIRATLATLQAAGARVEYRSVDVCDAAEFGALIDDVYARHGRIDGVIHGAGVTEDKFIRDKTLESFQRVLAPKVDGATVLASRLRPESLKFMFFFSSTAARYGNRGQGDYAAANEVLNKLALWLNARWPGRIASINWGPWEASSTSGMVSPELARQFAKAGIFIITRKAGRRAFIEELLYGRKEEVEVIYGGPLVAHPSPAEQSAEQAQPRAAVPQAVPQSALPLLASRTTTTRHADGTLEFTRVLEPSHDLYLLDHQLDGKPVMPMAMVLELLTEVAATGWPDMHLAAVTELRVLHGIMVENGHRALRILARQRSRLEDLLTIELKVESGEERPRICYTALAELRFNPPAASFAAPLELAHPRPFQMTVAEAYERWLFHGPLFAGISEIERIGDNGIIARLSPSSPQRCLAEAPATGAPSADTGGGRYGDWLIDPVVVDSGLQMLILWARTCLDMTPLPSRLGRYHRYAQAAGELNCEVRIVSTDGPTIHADLMFADAGGNLVGWMEDMEVTCSKALNRLAGKPANTGVPAGRAEGRS